MVNDTIKKGYQLIDGKITLDEVGEDELYTPYQLALEFRRKGNEKMELELFKGYVERVCGNC